MDSRYMSAFTTSYTETALWASVGDDDEPLDKTFGSGQFAESAAREIADELYDFVTQNWADLAALDPSQAGHDFFLTRNHHGAGFWDRGLGELGERLTKASHAYGTSEVYEGDDGELYVA